jgi:hypothetical protein
MTLALLEWNTDAYDRVLDELGDCAHYLRNATNAAVHLHANGFALQAGSLENAADFAAREDRPRPLP